METKRKKLISLALCSSLLSAGLHTYLSIKFYGLRYGFSNSSLCNINEKFNCDVASTSSFADIFNIPIALLGLLTNLVLAIFILNGFLSSKESHRPFRFGFYLANFVFFVSIVMAAISSLYLSSYCPFCIGTYFLSMICLISLYFTFPKDRELNIFADIPHLFKENKASLYLLFAVPILGFLINWDVQKRFTGERLDLFIQESLQSWKNRNQFSFNPTTGLIAGNDNAKFTIVEFADYLCPHCKNAVTSLKTFMASHQNVKLIHKPFPLDGSCNPGLASNSKGNGIRCRLSYAAYCAEKEFKQGWDYHYFIFENQESFIGLGSLTDVDSKLCSFNQKNCEKLKNCMALEETENWVKTASKEGADAQVAGTPTIFINGVKLDGGSNIMVLKSLYKELGL